MAAPPIPPGVTTRQATMSGGYGGGTVTFYQNPVYLLKLSTGKTMYRKAWTVKFDPTTGEIPAQTFAATDQDDLGVAAGMPIVDWTYHAVVKITGSKKLEFDFPMPSAGEGTADIDQLQHYDQPGGIVSIPAGVLSVAGLIGAVSAEDLAEALEFTSGLPVPTGNADKFLAVKSDASGYELVDAPEGGGGPGADGDDAYEVAVANGFSGSRSQWLASLVGPKGDRGDASVVPGPRGDPGPGGRVYVQQPDGSFLASGDLEVYLAFDTATPPDPSGYALLVQLDSGT